MSRTYTKNAHKLHKEAERQQKIRFNPEMYKFYDEQEHLTRFINIDWLQVTAKESPEIRCWKDYETRFGLIVRPHESGGGANWNERIEVFRPDGFKYAIINRSPKTPKSQGGIIPDDACNVQLCNRYCYDEYCTEKFADWLDQNGFRNVEAKRIDLCMDFVMFDDGTDPYDMIRDYNSGNLLKIGRSHVDNHGEDGTGPVQYHSMRWGTDTSMIVTRLYDKTLELAQQHDKPYIRNGWIHAGVLTDIDDPHRVFRLEFQISNKCKQFYSEDNEHKQGEIKWYNNMLFWYKRKNWLYAYKGLVKQYFRFVRSTGTKRKYESEPWNPFLWGNSIMYKPAPLPYFKDSGRGELMMLKKLEKLQEYYANDLSATANIVETRRLITQIYGCRKSNLNLSEIQGLTYEEDTGWRMHELCERIEADPMQPRSLKNAAEEVRAAIPKYLKEMGEEYRYRCYSEALSRYSSTVVELQRNLGFNAPWKEKVSELVELEQAASQGDMVAAHERDDLKLEIMHDMMDYVAAVRHMEKVRSEQVEHDWRLDWVKNHDRE